MVNRALTAPVIFLIFFFLTGCNEQKNPLLGQWRNMTSSAVNADTVIEFAPSTMRINDRTVTVVYQIRKNKVRVSASKNAIIYEIVSANEIHYENKNKVTVKLIRISKVVEN